MSYDERREEKYRQREREIAREMLEGCEMREQAADELELE